MDRLIFTGGSYVARSPIANYQRSINYYPEVNTKDSNAQITLYQRPGLRQLIAGPVIAPVRALYRPSTGIGGYAVIGQGMYYITPAWGVQQLGLLSPNRSNICSMIDNGTTLVVVDGSPNGWTVDLATQAFAPLVDSTGAFQGADRVDTLDTYVLFNNPGTRNFISTLSNSITFDPLYIAGKAAYPDLLQTLYVNRREILLMGSLKSEIWYNAGNVNFPFAELPGAYIEHGIAAKYSIASSDISVFWLGQDLQGQGIVFRQRGYETTRISNHAIEWALQELWEQGIPISDAIGWTYQQGGHVFYVLTFPSGDQTWVFDDSIGDPQQAWHQQAWSDGDGVLHRHRANCCAFINGLNVVGDWQNGAIYAMDAKQYYDDVGGVQSPLVCIRGFPHIMFGKINQWLSIPSNGLQVQHNHFWLDLECGNDPTQDVGPQLTLRYSDDRGRSWTTASLQSAGKLGQYSTMPKWPGMGVAVDRLYEISHAIPAQVALNGAWVLGRIIEQNFWG
jgi:hypothetical protein